MTDPYADLADDEVIERLVSAGHSRPTAQRLVAQRDDPDVARLIARQMVERI